jgi:hypothetical protein
MARGRWMAALLVASLVAAALSVAAALPAAARLVGNPRVVGGAEAYLPFFCLCWSRSRTMFSPSGSSPRRRATS